MNAKEMLVSEKIRRQMGEKWVNNTLGRPEPRDASDVADLVYFHYLESEDGQKMWAADIEDGMEKVDEIFDSIYTKYTEELGWMTEDDWQGISDELYSMVHEGVF